VIDENWFIGVHTAYGIESNMHNKAMAESWAFQDLVLLVNHWTYHMVHFAKQRQLN
jgi:hypothetical protein